MFAAPLSWDRLATIGSAIAVENAVRYMLFAGLAWLLGYVWFRQRWAKRKIVPAYPARTDVWREVRLSLLTVLFYGLVGAATVWAARQGWTQLYWRFDAHSGGWFVASIALTIVVHDAYFYWTHRLMHHPLLFRWFHRGHHLSTNPSPWAAYAFDPLESIVQAGIFPVVVLLYPMHPLAFAAFMIWQLTFNILGHAGYEFWPRWLMDSWLGKVVNTPTAHVLHHQHLRGHYGLYFNWWDRWLGTNLDHYETSFRAITAPNRYAESPNH